MSNNNKNIILPDQLSIEKFELAPGVRVLYYLGWVTLLDFGVELEATIVKIPPIPEPRPATRPTLEWWERTLSNHHVMTTIVQVAAVMKASAMIAQEFGELALTRFA